MCSALTDNHAPDESPAHRARLAGALIDPKVILKTAAAINPIKTGTIVIDPRL